ncbi:SGNH/GDSL hydrolase family protein [Actinomadura hibisca]|uniref:SGNH/GDSL hydrolase family protein n=1 Tax=Actinomadura hibisca TaxID=68565 RepID=UPI000830F22E|nr:SGNH/GDSL hydrolase family protein [Actinomadura hibisca]
MRALLVGVLVGGSMVVTGAARADGVEYAALGDSYSSGAGAGSYEAGTCRRSANAYPRLWSQAHGGTLAFVACAGATTQSVRDGQLGALRASTTLVSITVGGNDAGFARVMETCVLRSTDACSAAVAQSRIIMRDTLPARLDAVYGAIRTKAPSARVVVLGYPRLYTHTPVCVGLNATKRATLNKAADDLNDVIEDAAERSRFTFSDVRDEFAGHELCSGQGWIASVTVPLADSYHPTARGHRLGYLPAFASTVDRAGVL